MTLIQFRISDFGFGIELPVMLLFPYKFNAGLDYRPEIRYFALVKENFLRPVQMQGSIGLLADDRFFFNHHESGARNDM
ncbi:MAG TPA: hypothetical protein VKA69_10590, partial [Desulfobacteria bacterium]|nr:hypothetical protein [Desulfobacteria bacterium]